MRDLCLYLPLIKSVFSSKGEAWERRRFRETRMALLYWKQGRDTPPHLSQRSITVSDARESSRCHYLYVSVLSPTQSFDGTAHRDFDLPSSRRSVLYPAHLH